MFAISRRAWVVLLAAVTATVLVVLWSDGPSGTADLARLKASHRPLVGDYSAIPLPVDRPPDGADLRAVQQVGPGIGSQQMEFRYSGFTVTAGSVLGRASDFNPCAELRGLTLRTVDVDGWRTTYSASTKFGEGGMVDSVVDFFRTGTLAPRPGWIDSYVDAYVRKLYG